MPKWPVHQNPREEHAAKAPYNFVPLPERVVTVDPEQLPDQDVYDAARHTGWIKCKLTTFSPLYVRAALMPEEFERVQDATREAKLPVRERVRNKPDFFYAEDRLHPVIPGSSLRGMLRALVEIVSYGKMQWVADRQLVYRAVGDTTSHGEGYRERLMRFDGEGYEDGKRYYSYTPLMKAGYMEQKRNGEQGKTDICNSSPGGHIAKIKKCASHPFRFKSSKIIWCGKEYEYTPENNKPEK